MKKKASEDPQVVAYWEGRQRLLYYQVVHFLTEGLSENAHSMLDVGSAGSPFLDWFPHIPERVSVDRRFPYDGPGVAAFKADFLEWDPGRRFDVVTCLQVLEHVPEADVFAQKLLAMGDILVVSVPFQWPEGDAKTHVHDPVTREKVRSWFGCNPNFAYVCREVTLTAHRLIHVYDTTGATWRSLKERKKIAANQTEAAEAPAMMGIPIREAKPKSLGQRLLSSIRSGFR